MSLRRNLYGRHDEVVDPYAIFASPTFEDMPHPHHRKKSLYLVLYAFTKCAVYRQEDASHSR